MADHAQQRVRELQTKLADVREDLQRAPSVTPPLEQEPDGRRSKSNPKKDGTDSKEPEKAERERVAKLRDKQRRLVDELKTARDEVQKGTANITRARRDVREALLRRAEIVACTLSGAGGDLLSVAGTGPLFNAVIIDEVDPKAFHPYPDKLCAGLP